MALTAAPLHRAPGPGPSWDETIVPALRARLEDESRVLARRISAASLASSAGRSASENHWDIYDAYAAPDNDYPKPTAIPRPSLSSQPQPTTHTANYTSERERPQPQVQTKATPTRKRTLSSPKLPLPVPKSPSLNVNGSGGVGKTRIPVARARTGSTSSRATSANGLHAQGGSSTPDLGALTSRAGAQRSPDLSYPHSPQSNNSQSNSYFAGSPKEDAGRPSMSSHLRRQTGGGDDDVRASMESDERPFEHWYRGEAARNGGVGEYRVGRRQEMLEIANYGHTPRTTQNPRAGGVNGSGYTGEWVNTSLRARRGSLDGRHRESFYLDPDQAGGNVMDEVLDLDTGDSASEDVHGRLSSHGHGRKGHKPPPKQEPEEQYEEYDDDEDMGGEEVDDDETWHATPKVAQPRTPTPTQMAQRSITTDATSRTRAAPSPAPLGNRSASTPSPQPPRTTPNGRTPQNGTPASASATAKRRAKSPAAATPPNAKKAKAKSPPSAAASARAANARPGGKGGEDEKRRSIAAYPELGDDGEADMSHAIPTWTQPAKVGNWDEVVLPAVARKKGLEGYVRADGSPQPKEEREQVIEPAPGTFGYDYSKYKPGQRGGEEIPMDEFGSQRPSDPDALAEEAAREDEMNPDDPSSPKSPTKREKALPPLKPSASMRRAMQQPPSPAPFASYVPHEGMTMDTSQIPQPQTPRVEQRVEEPESGGCCKCVVM
ncbi:unnamed protein product [Peniophora sp. CBMAI 1063]|nr:unnamed protein product [Peniophora sp. CBMAI 1063]